MVGMPPRNHARIIKNGAGSYILKKVAWSGLLIPGCICAVAIALSDSRLLAQTLSPTELELPSEIFDNSPVLQRWSDTVPDVRHGIKHDPSFKTRWRIGYGFFPANGDRSGVSFGVEDIFIQPDFPVTLSTAVNTTFDGDRSDFSARANYYILPLGSPLNIAPTFGYQTFSSEKNGQSYHHDGLEIGGKIQLNLSRSGASNVTLSQQFINPTGEQEIGITTLGLGYAVTKNIRIATEIQKHNSTVAKESRVGLFLEWMP